MKNLSLPKTSDMRAKPISISEAHLKKQLALLQKLSVFSQGCVIELPGVTRFCDVKDYANVNFTSYVQVENGKFTILAEENIHGEVMADWKYDNRGWYERAMPARLERDGRVKQNEHRYGSYMFFALDKHLLNQFTSMFEKNPGSVFQWIENHKIARQHITEVEDKLVDCFRKTGAAKMDRTHQCVQWGLAQLRKYNPTLDNTVEMVRELDNTFTDFAKRWQVLGMRPFDFSDLTTYNLIAEAAKNGWEKKLAASNQTTFIQM